MQQWQKSKGTKIHQQILEISRKVSDDLDPADIEVDALAQSQTSFLSLKTHLSFFTQPPSGRRRMRICFCRCLFVFFVFFPSVKNMRQPFFGTAERIFMKLLSKDTGENVVWNVVPPLGKSRATAWRMANVDDLRNLRYDSFAITRGRHARRLCYKIVSLRTDLI